MVLPSGVIQALQVVVVLVFAPFVSGAIAQVEARLQGRRGPEFSSLTTTWPSCSARRPSSPKVPAGFSSSRP